MKCKCRGCESDKIGAVHCCGTVGDKSGPATFEMTRYQLCWFITAHRYRLYLNPDVYVTFWSLVLPLGFSLAIHLPSFVQNWFDGCKSER